MGLPRFQTQVHALEPVLGGGEKNRVTGFMVSKGSASDATDGTTGLDVPFVHARTRRSAIGLSDYSGCDGDCKPLFLFEWSILTDQV